MSLQEITNKLIGLDFRLKTLTRELELDKALIKALEEKITLLEQKIEEIQHQHID